MPKPQVDPRIEIFTYGDISKQTGLDSSLLRKVARRMNIEQTVFMRSSYGRVSPASKQVGVRERNIGRLIKAAAEHSGRPYVRDIVKELPGDLDSSSYSAFRGRKSQPDPEHDQKQAEMMDDLEKKLGL